MLPLNAGRPILQFTGVTAGYGHRPVFRDLSFSLVPSEGVCLLGRNGCGKSTVLRSVLGLADVLAGAIEFDGRNVRFMARSDFAGRGLAYVPQGRGDFPSLTVEENIRLAAWSGANQSPRRVVEAVFDEIPFIAPFRSRKVGQLSGGERTLVALARALALRPWPRLLLLDEVSAGLSQVNAQVVASVLTRVRQEGATILMAEQNTAFASSLAFPLLEPRWQIEEIS